MKRCKFQFGIWKKRRATSDRLRVGLRCRRIDMLFQTPIKADVIKLESRINLENAAQHSSMKQCKFQFEILKIERATSDRLRVGTKWRRNENEKQKGPDLFFNPKKKRKEKKTKQKRKRNGDTTHSDRRAAAQRSPWNTPAINGPQRSFQWRFYRVIFVGMR